MKRFAHVAVLALAAQALLFAPQGLAQSAGDQREQLTQLYRITISQDICSFPLTEKQADVVTQKTDDLESRLDLSEADAQKLYDQIEAQMTKQKDAGLCNPDGEWAKVYTALVETMK